MRIDTPQNFIRNTLSRGNQAIPRKILRNRRLLQKGWLNRASPQHRFCTALKQHIVHHRIALHIGIAVIISANGKCNISGADMIKSFFVIQLVQRNIVMRYLEMQVSLCKIQG